MVGEGQILGRIVELIRVHAPGGDANWAAFIGICAVVIGVLVGLYGAYLSRFLLCMVFGGAAAGLGWLVALRVGVSPLVVAGISAVVAVGLAAFLYRVVAGVVTAGLVAGMALGFYSVKIAWPEVGAFEDWVSGGAGREIELVSAAEQIENLQPKAGERMGQFWDFLQERRPSTRREVELLAVAAGGMGLLVGLLLPRLVMTVWLSLAGAVLSVSGVLTLLAVYRPGWFEQIGQRQYVLCPVIGVLWVLWLFVHLRAKLVGRKGSVSSDTAPAKS